MDISLYGKDYTDDNFKTYVDNIFVQIHLSFMMKEIKPIRNFISYNLEEKDWILTKVVVGR